MKDMNNSIDLPKDIHTSAVVVGFSINPLIASSSLGSPTSAAVGGGGGRREERRLRPTKDEIEAKRPMRAAQPKLQVWQFVTAAFYFLCGV